MGTRRLLRRSRLAAAVLLLVSAVAPAQAGPAPAAGAGPREVVVKTADKLQVYGTFHASGTAGSPGAVLLPMYASDRASWEPLVRPLLDRGVSVLAIDPRGHGKSAKQGKTDLQPLVEKRDPKLFGAMHEDAIAAVRWLAKDGGCDPKRVVLVGASVGGSVAVDAARRHPTEVAAVVWLSPGVRYLGIDTLTQLKELPPALPVLLMSHGDEANDARKIADARPGTRLVVYDDPAPEDAGAERGWAHGTRMLGRLPLADLTVASYVAVATGSTKEDVVLDGIVAEEGPAADPWGKAVDVGTPDGPGTVHAIRVGRRILFGGVAREGVHGLRFEVQTGAKLHDAGGVPTLGPPQIVGADLTKGEVTWSWGGMGSMPSFPGMGPVFGKTVPRLRAVATDGGTAFEGEWFVPAWGSGPEQVRLLIAFEPDPPAAPSGGMVGADPEHAVDLPSR